VLPKLRLTQKCAGAWLVAMAARPGPPHDIIDGQTAKPSLRARTHPADTFLVVMLVTALGG